MSELAHDEQKLTKKRRSVDPKASRKAFGDASRAEVRYLALKASKWAPETSNLAPKTTNLAIKTAILGAWDGHLSA